MYLIDADVLIQAKNLHYGFDFCPAFWNWLIDAHSADLVFSITEIREEVLRGEDELTEWVRHLPETFFIGTPPTIGTHYTTVTKWADTADYFDTAKRGFLSAADYHLVCSARATGYTVVTQEASAPDAKAKIKLPDACDANGVNWTSTFELLRKERARFVLP